MSITNRVAILFALLSAWGIASANPVSSSQIKLVPTFDKTMIGIRYKPQPHNHIYGESRHVSPDGRFVARLTVGDGEYAYLTVYRRNKSGNTFINKNIVSRQFELVDGCAWVPGHSHWLLVSEYNDGDRAGIALWRGNQQVRFLLRTHYGSAAFNLLGVASNGRFISYEHFGPGTADPKYKRNTRYRMNLPTR